MERGDAEKRPTCFLGFFTHVFLCAAFKAANNNKLSANLSMLTCSL